MIAELSGMLLILLIVLTVLGAVIGYCIALLRSKRMAVRVISAEKARIRGHLSSRVRADLESAKQDRTLHRPPDISTKALDNHSETQAKKIVSLEAEIKELRLAASNTQALAADGQAQNMPKLSRMSRAAETNSKHFDGELGYPLAQELEIPALAESELPDSVEDLDFDIVDNGEGGASTRG